MNTKQGYKVWQKLNSDTDRAMIDDFLREETEAAR